MTFQMVIVFSWKARRSVQVEDLLPLCSKARAPAILGSGGYHQVAGPFCDRPYLPREVTSAQTPFFSPTW